jgi:PAS domain S-box-containing protein
MRHSLVNKFLIPDADGGEPLVGGIAIDITERMRAEEEASASRSRLVAAQAIAHIGSWEWDIASNKVSWSDELYRIFGLDAATVPATFEGFIERVHPDDRPFAREVVETCMRTHAPFAYDHRIVRPDGVVRAMRANGGLVVDGAGAPVRMTGTGQDITEQKAIEDALRASEAKLRESAAVLKRSNEDLQQFAYVASHDLQAPLRHVAGYAELVAARYADKLDEKGSRYLANLLEGVARMQSLIEDLLAYSRVETQGAAPEEVESDEICRQAARILTRETKAADAVIDIAPLPRVHADATQVRQIFQNLLQNAIKFGGDEAPRIRVEAEREGAFIHFRVLDNGRGFDPQYKERIFIMFQRLQSPQAAEGSGIGLAICKRIVERHGGTMWAESAPGAGSTFHFTLPASQEAVA